MGNTVHIMGNVQTRWDNVVIPMNKIEFERETVNKIDIKLMDACI
jgi:hypothetical protein